jgi:DNA-binding winged helix-turn-helix (wHTH) protein
MTGERSAPTQETISFGPFELSSGERILRRDGLVLPLGGRAFDILIYLVGRPGEVVTKDELIHHAWPNVVVEEGSLRVHVAAIRKALGDGQFGNRYIANIKGRGYCFVAPVSRLAMTASPRICEPTSAYQIQSFATGLEPKSIIVFRRSAV